MGLVVPLWIWLPVFFWVLWRWEHRQRVFLEKRASVGFVSETSEPVMLLEGGRVLLGKREARRGLDMKSLYITTIFGVLAVFLYAWEPAPGVTQVSAPEVATAPGNINVPAQPVPPGMIYDAAHNSYHYPPAGYVPGAHQN